MKYPNQFLGKRHQGVFTILFAVIIVALVGLAALVIDLGFMHTAKAQLQAATDAGALAGAGALPQGNSTATSTATSFVANNNIFSTNSPTNVQVQLGTWNSQTETFTPTTTSPNAVSVTASYTGPFYFAEIFNKQNYTVTSTSVASLNGASNDVIFVQDTGPQMSNWSTSQGVANGSISATAAAQNQTAIYNSLNLPPLGNLTPTRHTCGGNTNQVLNQLELTNMQYPNSCQNWNGNWNDWGCNGQNSNWQNTNTSWNGYVNYIQTDPNVAAAGNQNTYCHQTYADYLVSSQVPLPASTPIQPLQGTKDAICGLANNLSTTNDTCGLRTIHGSNPNNHVPLTNNIQTVTSAVSTQVCGGSQNNNNVQSQLNSAISELQNDTRPGINKSIILCSSAQFNWNQPSDRASALQCAATAAAANIKIHTVCLGNNGDTGFMKQLASTSGGNNYTVPNGTTDVTSLTTQMSQDLNLGGNPQLVQ